MKRAWLSSPPLPPVPASSSSRRLARTLALIAAVLAPTGGCGGSRDLSIGTRIDAGGPVTGTGGTTPGTGGALNLGAGGSISIGTGGTAATGFGGSGAGGAAGAADSSTAGPRLLRLLTRREYLNTLRDLFGLSIDANSLPADEAGGPWPAFPFHTTGAVLDPIALQYRDAAESLAKSALTSIKTWLPCASTVTADASADTEATCLTTFLGPTGLATKIYRRPLTAASNGTGADVARLTQLYAIGREPPLSLDFTGSIGLMIEAMLQSTEFLYHWQVDTDASIHEGAVVKLGNYEIANRLSYLLWGSMPDDALFAAAAAGQLGELANIETQVRRMLKDPKAAGTFADFFTDWLDIDTLAQTAKVSPAYTGTLVAAMTLEVEDFVKAILVNGTGRLDDVLTGTWSIANPELAALYGVSGVAGSTLGPVSLNPAQRSGLLTTAGFLSLTGSADGSNPPRRGVAILNKLLCQPVLIPPAVVPPPAPVQPGFTTRQRFEQHALNPCATACHTVIDPFGYAFENYDGIGAYRTLDNGLPVNASTTIMLDGQPRTVPDARGLSAALAASDEVQTCFTRQWFRYGLGRPDTDQDLASINAAAVKFKNSMRDIREMIVALATSRTFRYRTPGTGEVLP